MPELRKDPVIDRWVIIAAERGRRPNDFTTIEQPVHGSFCPFCPGNESRTPAEIAQWGREADAPPNSPGWRIRAVPNKFPALTQQGEVDPQGVGMFDMMNAIGAHEIVIENPNHDWDFADAEGDDLSEIFQAYTARLLDLRQDKRFSYIIVFRNSGTAAGATLAHPHSQIIALPINPKQVKEYLGAARDYYRRKRRCIFCDVLRQELNSGERIVDANEHFVLLSPFAARFPFELQVMPRRHCHDFTLITRDEQAALSALLTRNLKRVRAALSNPAYNLLIQTAPNVHEEDLRRGCWGTLEHDYHWRINILPRLTSMAGFEWATGFYINPVAPENVAQFLEEAETGG